MSEPTDDRKLLLAYHRDGSHESFGQLVGKYSPMVFQTALRRTRDHQLAEDVTQAVFIVLARRSGSLRSHESIAGWLHQTAIFASSSALRAQMRQRKHESAAAKPEAIVHPAPSESTELTARIEEELHRLPTIHRNVLMLHYLEGKTIPQAAEVLGVTHETARKRMSRALERLRKRLARRGVVADRMIIVSTIGTSFLVTGNPSISKAASAAVVGGNNGNAFSLATDLIHSIRLLALKKAAAAAIITLSITGLGVALAQTEPIKSLSTATTMPATARAQIDGKQSESSALSDMVVAGLRQRESLLTNFSYEAKQSVSVSSTDAATTTNRAPSIRQFAMKRLGDAYRFDQVSYKSDGALAGTFSGNWFNNVATGLNNMVGADQQEGVLTDTKFQNTNDFLYNHLLGFHAPSTAAQGSTLAKWIADCAKDVPRFDVRSITRDGSSLIEATVHMDDGRRHVISVDPSRGFLVTDMNYFAENGAAYSRNIRHVSEAILVDGVWIPSKVVCRYVWSQRPNEVTERAYTVSNFKLNTVRPQDLAVGFPPNTLVMDKLRNEVYTLLADGEKRFERFYDPEAGMIINPKPAPTGVVVESSNPRQVAAGEHGATLRSTGSVAGAPTNSWQRGIGAVVMLSVILAALLILRTWRRKQAIG